MKATNEDTTQIRHQEVAELAKQIWEMEGRQPGRDLEYWLRAERLVHLQSSRGNESRPGTSSPRPISPAGPRGPIRLPDSIATGSR